MRSGAQQPLLDQQGSFVSEEKNDGSVSGQGGSGTSEHDLTSHQLLHDSDRGQDVPINVLSPSCWDRLIGCCQRAANRAQASDYTRLLGASQQSHSSTTAIRRYCPQPKHAFMGALLLGIGMLTALLAFSSQAVVPAVNESHIVMIPPARQTVTIGANNTLALDVEIIGQFASMVSFMVKLFQGCHIQAFFPDVNRCAVSGNTVSCDDGEAFQALLERRSFEAFIGGSCPSELTLQRIVQFGSERESSNQTLVVDVPPVESSCRFEVTSPFDLVGLPGETLTGKANVEMHSCNTTDELTAMREDLPSGVVASLPTTPMMPESFKAAMTSLHYQLLSASHGPAALTYTVRRGEGPESKHTVTLGQASVRSCNQLGISTVAPSFITDQQIGVPYTLSGSVFAVSTSTPEDRYPVVFRVLLNNNALFILETANVSALQSILPSHLSSQTITPQQLNNTLSGSLTYRSGLCPGEPEKTARTVLVSKPPQFDVSGQAATARGFAGETVDYNATRFTASEAMPGDMVHVSSREAAVGVSINGVPVDGSTYGAGDLAMQLSQLHQVALGAAGNSNFVLCMQPVRDGVNGPSFCVTLLQLVADDCVAPALAQPGPQTLEAQVNTLFSWSLGAFSITQNPFPGRLMQLTFNGDSCVVTQASVPGGCQPGASSNLFQCESADIATVLKSTVLMTCSTDSPVIRVALHFSACPGLSATAKVPLTLESPTSPCELKATGSPANIVSRPDREQTFQLGPFSSSGGCDRLNFFAKLACEGGVSVKSQPPSMDGKTSLTVNELLDLSSQRVAITTPPNPWSCEMDITYADQHVNLPEVQGEVECDLVIAVKAPTSTIQSSCNTGENCPEAILSHFDISGFQDENEVVDAVFELGSGTFSTSQSNLPASWSVENGSLKFRGAIAELTKDLSSNVNFVVATTAPDSTTRVQATINFYGCDKTTSAEYELHFAPFRRLRAGSSASFFKQRVSQPDRTHTATQTRRMTHEAYI